MRQTDRQSLPRKTGESVMIELCLKQTSAVLTCWITGEWVSYNKLSNHILRFTVDFFYKARESICVLQRWQAVSQNQKTGGWKHSRAASPIWRWLPIPISAPSTNIQTWRTFYSDWQTKSETFKIKYSTFPWHRKPAFRWLVLVTVLRSPRRAHSKFFYYQSRFS